MRTRYVARAAAAVVVVLTAVVALVTVGPWLIAGGPSLWALVLGMTPLALLAIGTALDATDQRRRRRSENDGDQPPP